MSQTDNVIEKKPQSKEELKEPSLYQVVLINDDFTTMEFVVHVIQKVFHKSEDEASAIMMNIHKEGKGICGVFPYEIAETKATEVIYEARKNEYPLLAVVEKVE